MAAPTKPWERAGVNSQNMTSTLNNSMSSGPMPDVMGGPMATPGGPSTSLGNQNPPPVPTRPTQQRSGLTSSYGMGGYGSGYGSYGGYSSYSPLGGGMYGGSMYGGGMYGGYGGYSGYGSGLGMNRYGPSEYTSNGFVRQAEESSRQAFQSIESVVQAFGSVTMMLESTFYAVYNSFRAVIGVADHFTRLRTHFAQIFSAFAIIKTLKWLYHRLLVLLRLRQAGMDEDLWANAVSETVKGTGLDGIPGKPKSNWPVWLFFAVVIGAPYLIWRLLSSLSGAKENNSWADGSGDHFVGVAEYSFEGENEDEISFRKGQRLNIAPKELQPRMRGWLLASADGKKQGIVPANYIKVLGKRRGRKQGPQTLQELGNSQLAPSAGQCRNQDTGAGIPHQMEAVYDSTQGDASMNEVFNDNSQNFSSYYPRETSRDTIETKEASDILNDTSKPWEP